MRKVLPRLVAFLLVLSLIGDPGLAAALSQQQSIVGHSSEVSANNFLAEALEPAAAPFTDVPLSRPATRRFFRAAADQAHNVIEKEKNNSRRSWRMAWQWMVWVLRSPLYVMAGLVTGSGGLGIMLPPTPIRHSATTNGEETPEEKQAVLQELGIGPDELTDSRIAKRSDWSRRDLYMRYNRLPDDHPVARYVQNIFNDALGADAKDFQIVVLPEWAEINAGAYPDGVIIVSGGLLQFAKYEDELKAILAHEALHVKHQHFRATIDLLNRSKSKDANDVNTGLRLMGLSRLQEYEADLRWMVDEFQHRNINPLGLLSFVERLDEYHKKYFRGSSPDIAHGFLEDRALNIESIFYFLDIAGLSGDLKPVSAEFQEALRKVTTVDRIRLTTEVGSHIQEGSPEYERLQDRRMDITDELPLDQIPMALAAVHALLLQRGKSLKGQPQHVISKDDRSASHRGILASLADRLDAELFTVARFPDAKKRSLARAAYYELQAGVSPYILPGQHLPTLDSDELEERRQIDVSALASLEDAYTLLAILRDPSFEFVNASRWKLRELSSRIYGFAWETLGLKDAQDAIKLDEFKRFVSDWSAGLAELTREKGLDVVQRNDLEARGRQFWQGPDKKKTSVNGNGRKEIKEVADSTAIYEIVSHLRGYINPTQPFSGNKALYGMLQQACAGLDYEHAIELFFYVRFVLAREMTEEAKAYQDRQEAEGKPLKGGGTDDQIEFHLRLAQYQLFRLFEQAMETWPIFQPLPDYEKHIWLTIGLEDIVYGQDLGMIALRPVVKDNRLVLEELEYSGENVGDFFELTGGRQHQTIAPEDRTYLERRLARVDQEWFGSPFSRDQLVTTYNQIFLRGPEIRHSSFYKGPPSVSAGLFTHLLARHLAGFENWDDFFAEVDALEKNGVPAKQIITDNRNIFGLPLAQLWKNLPPQPNLSQLKQFREAISFIDDPFLRVQALTYYYQVLWPSLDFNTKLDELFSAGSGGVLDLRKLNDFVENECKTKEQLHAVQARFKTEFETLMTNSAREAGVAAALSNISMSKRFAKDLLLSLLDTSVNDGELKEVIFSAIDYCEVLSQKKAAGDTDEEDLARGSRLADQADTITNLLLRMDTGAKLLLLRKLLTGDFGLVSRSANRADFLRGLLDRTVTSQNGSDLRQTMHQVIEGLGGMESWKLLFFALQPILAARMAIPPEKSAPWRGIVPKFIQLENPSLWSRMTELTRNYSYYQKKASEFRLRPWIYTAETSRYAKEALRRQLEARGIAQAQKIEVKLAPLSFVVEVARNLGALGVRFLQLLPQFVHLTDEEQDEFSKIYDANEGQSKLTALAVLEREWPTIWDEVETIEERVGGGSLFTVYKIKLKDGTYDVIKVLNPNLQFTLDRTFRFLEALIDILVKRFGEKYSIGRSVIQDVKEWIERDINFKGFLAKDLIFKAQNDGFTSSGFRYQMSVPDSRGPESYYFMRERFVQGKNLTQWQKLIDDGEDMKQVVSLITKNYVAQLRAGRAHSDVHIGNFRVTPNGLIAILDRGMQLELTPAMQQFVELLLNPFGLMMTAPEQFIDKILAMSGAEISPQSYQRLAILWGKTRNAIMAGDWAQISSFLVGLRQEGVRLPLEVRLIFKNLNALQHMAKRAGFKNLFDAYLYVPPVDAPQLKPDAPTQKAPETKTSPRPARQRKPRINGGTHDIIMFVLRFLPKTVGVTTVMSLLARTLSLPYGAGLALTMFGASISFVLEQGWLTLVFSRLKSSYRHRLIQRQFALAA